MYSHVEIQGRWPLRANHERIRPKNGFGKSSGLKSRWSITMVYHTVPYDTLTDTEKWLQGLLVRTVPLWPFDPRYSLWGQQQKAKNHESFRIYGMVRKGHKWDVRIVGTSTFCGLFKNPITYEYRTFEYILTVPKQKSTTRMRTVQVSQVMRYTETRVVLSYVRQTPDVRYIYQEQYHSFSCFFPLLGVLLAHKFSFIDSKNPSIASSIIEANP